VSGREPLTELDSRFSSDGVQPTAWADASNELETAAVYWLSTVRADGRPHVTPLIAVWQDEALYFCTGPDEQKAKNLEHNPHCIATTGRNRIDEGLDVVVEGDAVRVRDDARLTSVADAYEAKYGREWHFDVRDGNFHHEAGDAWVFEIAPAKVLGFGKGEPFSQTRYRFANT
jgi:nitroimidazol reductase NimA-like FMN-containing flavoprotein (pyridoxamine 5'-phosphate oxidase superfamily)